MPTEWPSATIYPHVGCPSAANYPSAAIYPHAGYRSAANYPSAAIYLYAGCPSAVNYPHLQLSIRMLDVHMIEELRSSASRILLPFGGGF